MPFNEAHLGKIGLKSRQSNRDAKWNVTPPLLGDVAPSVVLQLDYDRIATFEVETIGAPLALVTVGCASLINRAESNQVRTRKP